MDAADNSLRVLKADEVFARLRAHDAPYTKNYLAMYSSWLGGITTDPALMLVPVDDHIVHRGDGIFEAIKCTGGQIYGLKQHLQRLERSAGLVHMPMPVTHQRMMEIIVELIRVAGAKDCLIRLFVSRGPGGFTTNPYECVGSQLYIVITALRHYPEEKYQRGATMKTSSVPIKEGYFANVKSCNYLPNVLMKKEAVDAGVDFTVSLDEHGQLGEGSTENVAIVTAKNELWVPRFERTLRGITVLRTMELAQELVKSGELHAVREADIKPEQAYKAAEAMLLGTTLDVLPVTKYDGHVIGSGEPGPITKRLLELVRRDLKSGGDEILTRVF